MQSKSCPKCGLLSPETQSACDCGYSFVSGGGAVLRSARKCSQCGERIRGDARFCGRCGAALRETSVDSLAADLHSAQKATRNGDTLVAEGLLQPGENIVLFYSEALFSIKEAGNILTDMRVVSYGQLDGQRFVDSVRYSDIGDVVVEQEANTLNETVIAISTVDQKVFRLLASTEEQGDLALVEELRQRWQAARR